MPKDGVRTCSWGRGGGEFCCWLRAVVLASGLVA